MGKIRHKVWKYDVSIGMIVKNEKEVLKRCLESIMPLKKELKCEIIITDTGSVDGTVEIAKEYADKFIEFEWCDDFAKARNTGVEAAEGQWFLQIDADEYFDEQIYKLIQFIKSSDADKYDSVIFSIRNYKTEKLSTHNDSRIARMFNYTNGKRYYEHPIHEAIPIKFQNVKRLDLLLHHTGYCKEIMSEKRNRNAALMEEEVRKRPSDIRNYCLLVDCYSDTKKKVDICLTGVAQVNKEDIVNEECIPYLQSLLCKYSYELQEYYKVLEYAEKYLTEDIKRTNAALEMFYIAGYTSMAIHNYEKAICYFERYIKLYQILEETPDEKYSLFGVYYYFNTQSYLDAKLKLIHSYNKNVQSIKARELLKAFEGFEYENEESELVEYAEYVQLAYELELYDLGAKSYIHMLNQLNEKDGEIVYERKRGFLVDVLENQRDKLDSDIQKQIDYGFTKILIEDSYIALSNLRYLNFELNEETLKLESKIEADVITYQNQAFADYLYARMSRPQGFIEFTSSYRMKQLQDFLDIIISRHLDTRRKIYNILASGIVQSESLEIGILMYAYLKIVNYTITEAEKAEVMKIFDMYIKKTNVHIQNIYKIEELYANIDILPEQYVFPFIIKEYYHERNTQPVKYIRGLKESMLYDRNLVQCIEIVAKAEQEKAESQMSTSQEFQILGEQVKIQIKAFVNNKQYSEAKMILEQYEKVNPRDVEIMALYELLQNR